MDYQIQHIQYKQQELRSLILVFTGEFSIWLANKIIKLKVTRVELAQANITLSQPTNTMASIRNIQQHHTLWIVTQRAYWAAGQLVGARIRNFRQIQYLPLPNTSPDIDQALSKAWMNCGLDIHKQLVEFWRAAKVLITVQVRYEPAKPNTENSKDSTNI